MQKSFVLTAGLILALSGCQSKSPIWQKVVETSHATGDAEDGPRAYAGELHRVLTEAAVPHKVVTFEFGYRGTFDPFLTAHRTAVIYRDSASTKHPWWIMDGTLDRPVWLPTASVERQVSFYVRRPAKVLEVNDFAGFDDKDIRPDEPRRRPVATSRIEPVQPTTTIVAPRASHPVVIEHTEPAAPRPGFFHRGLFAPRAPKVAPAPVVKTTPVSSIQPAKTNSAKPVHVAEPAHKTSPKAATPSPKKAAAPAPETDSKPAAKARETAPADPKPTAAPAPKKSAAPISSNKPEIWESPAPLSTDSNFPVAAQATPKPGAKPRSAPLINQPADKPKDPVEDPAKKKTKFRAPLINQPDPEPTPAPRAEIDRPGLLRRILGTLNPRRLFTKA
jgi:hypothetical protein